MSVTEFSTHQLVEICGDSEDGFRGSWCEAVILETKGKERILVQYVKFVDDDTKLPLREAVLRKRVRPAPPVELARFKSIQDLKLGDSVEVYQDDCWWQGAVVYVARAGVQVNLYESNDSTLFIRDPHELRPRMQFQTGSWRRVVPSRPALRKLGLPAKEVEAAVKAMQAAPDVPMGPPRLQPPPTYPTTTTTAAAGTSATAVAAAAGAALPMPSQTGHPAPSHTSPWAAKRRSAAAAAADADAQAASGAVAEVKKGHAAGKVAGGARAGAQAAGVEKQRAGTKRRRDEDEEEEDGEEDGEDEEEEEQEERAGGEAAGPSSAAAAAAGAAAADPGRPSRPRREGKSRLVYVNGVPVLKANMYGLEDEDTLAWQRGLRNGQADLGGVQFAPPPAPSRQQPPKAPRAPAAPREHPPEYLARQEHNNAIRADAQAGQVSRARYLLQHLDRIRPFITQQAEAHIRRLAAGPGPAAPQPPAPPVTQQPEQVLATLREYQLEGLAWMVAQWERGVNAILADEMGLGKTLQTITFLAHLKFVCGVGGPHLVVVPLSVLSSWMSEFRKWCPSLRVVRLHSVDQEERRRLVKEVLGNPASFDVAVTTYDMVNSQHFGHSLKHTLVWRYLVLDEGHKVKNEETRVSDGMRHISRQQVLLLTGTPIQNNLHELFALLSFLYPDVFTDATRFDEAFNLGKNKVDRAALTAAHYLLRPFMLRRLKEEVEVSLPPRLETRIQCPLAPMQTFWYRRLLLREGAMLAQMEAEEAGAPHPSSAQQQQLVSGGEGLKQEEEEGQEEEEEPGPAGMEPGPAGAGGGSSGGGSSGGGGGGGGGRASNWKKAMNLLLQLRKVCNHPFMFPDAEPDFDGGGDSGVPEELVTGSGKMMVLDRLLAKLQQRGHRVVLFSQFNIMLDIIEDYLAARGYSYRRLDGSTNRIKRMIDMEQFNKPGSDIFIYILCTRAGGLGVNLQTADTCILYDSDWNPQWDLQAMARVHRIGQTRPVHVYRLVSEGSVEERMQRRAEAKLYLDQMVNRGSTGTSQQLEGLHAGEVLAMLRFGADRIFRNEAGDMPSEEQLEAIMDRSRMQGGVAAAAAVLKTGPSGEAAAAVGTAGGGGGGEGAGGDMGSGAAGCTGGGGGGGGLTASKHTAAEFNAEAAPVDTFVFQGKDFRALRAASAQAGTLRDIAGAFWAEQQQGQGQGQGRSQRQRRERLVCVDGFQVLRDNNYTMEEGMLHFEGQQRGKTAAADAKRKPQRAGVDYEHMDFCLVCWEGGDLLCCDHCPAAFHPACLGLSEGQTALLAKRNWSCPHHSCVTCERNTQRAGGLLFRCEMCEKAFCEDDLPPQYHMVGECEMFKALGQVHPRQACFIHCSNRCRELASELRPLIQHSMAARPAGDTPAAEEAVERAVATTTAGGAKGGKRKGAKKGEKAVAAGKQKVEAGRAGAGAQDGRGKGQGGAAGSGAAGGGAASSRPAKRAKA